MTGPWRRDFDAARDPYTARNALGITTTGGGGGGGAPTDAEYIVAVDDPTLTNDRVLTNTATVTWDFTTPGQAKASTAGGGGNVSNSGTPTVGQYAKWVTATTIQGVAPATVLSDIGGQPAGSYQPLDGDLTAIAALTGTNTIYYRSAADTWSAVTIGANLTFTGGTLAASGGGGGTPGGSNTQIQYNNSSAFGGSANLTWNNGTSVLTLTGGLTIVAGAATSITADGVVKASAFQSFGTNASLGPVTAGNVTLRPNGIGSATGQVLVAASGSMTVNGNIELGNATDTTLSRVSAGTVAIEGQNILTAATGQPLDADLTAIAALTGTNTIYYRSASNVWSPVVVGTGLAFSGGTLAAATGGASNKILLNDYRPVGVVEQVIPVSSLAGYDVIEIEFSITHGGSIAFCIVYSFDGGATYYVAPGGYHFSATLSYTNIGTGLYSGVLGWPGAAASFIYLFPGLDSGYRGSGTAKVYGINLAGANNRPWLINSYSYSAGYTYTMSASAACMGNLAQPTHIRICSTDLATTFAAGSFIKVYGLV